MTSNNVMPDKCDLYESIKLFGISESWFTNRGYKMSTIWQYCKRSSGATELFLDNFSRELQSSLQTIRQTIFERNCAQFGSVSFSLYAHGLPALKIEELPGSEFTNLPDTVRDPKNKAITFTQNDWADRCLAHCQGASRTDLDPFGTNVIVIMGHPGSGKTTELKRLLLKAQLEKWTCVFVPLAVYAIGDETKKRPNDIFEAAAQYYMNHLHVEIDLDFASFLRQESRSGRLIVFLDSLDEAPVTQRDQIVKHIRNHKSPVFVTSRYISPRLDKQETELNAALIWHLAGLSEANIVQHIRCLKDRYSSMYDIYANSKVDQALQSVLHMTQTMSFSNQNGRKEIDTEILDLINLPIYLNLYIGLCIERGPGSYSIDDIVSRYVDFLLNSWAMARSVLPQPNRRNVDLKRALAYLGYELTIREYQRVEPPSPLEAKGLLFSYFKATDQSGRTDDDIVNIVTDAMDRARTAQLFEPDDGTYIKFGSPADVLREYNLAQFIGQASIEPRSRISRPTVRQVKLQLPALAEASYYNFLSNPNLRFLSRGATLYMRSLFNNPAVTSQFVGTLLDEALGLDPVDLSAYGVGSESLRKILPLNLVFIGNIFANRQEDEYDYDQRNIAIREMRELFLRTNFERVFRELWKFVKIKDVQTSDPIDWARFSHLDQRWRSMTDARDLISFGKKIIDQKGKPSTELPVKFDVVLRRIIYLLRYFPENFDQDCCDWLKEIHYREEKFSDTAIMSARVLRKNTKELNWEYFEDKIDLERTKNVELARHLNQAWRESGKFSKSISYLISNIIEDHQKFSFYDLSRNRTFLNEIANEGFDVDIALSTLSATLIRKRDAEEKSKALLVLRNLSQNFDIQQAIMPSKYHLKSWHKKENNGRNDKVADLILATLCETAVGHFPSSPEAEGKEVIAKAGAEDSQKGGLQIYDYAVDTLWTLFGGYGDE